MRMAFGLVSLLVTLAIILMVFKYLQAPVLKEGKKAQDQARQMSGRDEDGARVTDAVTLDAQDKAGKMESVIVTDIAPGALQQRYGLQKGDIIVEMGPLKVRDNMSGPEEAKDWLLDAYQKSYELVVLRGWDRLTLPAPESSRAAAPAAPAAAPPKPAPEAPGAQADASKDSKDAAAKPAPQRDNRGALQRQLDLIQNVPGQ